MPAVRPPRVGGPGVCSVIELSDSSEEEQVPLPAASRNKLPAASRYAGPRKPVSFSVPRGADGNLDHEAWQKQAKEQFGSLPLHREEREFWMSEAGMKSWLGNPQEQAELYKSGKALGSPKAEFLGFGARVEVRHLDTKPELVGKRGCIVPCAADGREKEGRVAVRFDHDRDLLLSIRMDNVLPTFDGL